MPTGFTVKVKEREHDIFGARIKQRAKTLVDLDAKARKAAAQRATEVSRKSFVYVRPANAPKRAGRSSTGGKIRSKMVWKTDDNTGSVRLDVGRLDSAAKHWLIHEIGTGERASIMRGGSPNPRGRAKAGSAYVRTVRKQRGRLISSGLAFGSGPGGRYSPPGARRGQQLYPFSSLTDVTPFRRRRALVIGREIKGQHFIKKGGTEAFREYRGSALAAARSAFGGQKFRP